MAARQVRARKSVIALTAVFVTAGAIASGIAVQQTAAAATNGAQLHLCTQYNAYAVQVEGTNQDGVVTKTLVGLDNRDGSGCVYAPGYWWKGTVHLTWQYVGQPENTLSRNDCTIPDNLWDDYFACADSNGNNPEPDPSTPVTLFHP